MASPAKMHCALCPVKKCRSDQRDCYEAAVEHLQRYENDEVAPLHRVATQVEGEHYGQAPRLLEIMLLARQAGFQKLGLAFCIGLAEEARIIERLLAQQFAVISACCKISGIGKQTLDLRQIDPDDPGEVMGNPAGQAALLKQAGTELTIICGLCLGHDAIFSMQPQAPVTTLIAKDRVLGHNPVAALDNRYVRQRFFGEVR